MTSESSALAEELQRLKNEQDEAMLLAVYVGMTKEQAKLYDARGKRIREICEMLFALKKR